MDQKVKKQWVNELRSGVWKQAFGELMQEYDPATGESYGEAHYCCLGVLCETANLKYKPTDGIPEPEELDKVGLYFKFAQRLAQLNDSGQNFARIADFIEEYEEDYKDSEEIKLN